MHIFLNFAGNMHIPPANIIETDGFDNQIQEAMDLIHDSKNNLYELSYDIGPSTVLGVAQLSDLKRRYRDVVLPIKNILTRHDLRIPDQNRSQLGQVLVNAVESFVTLADKQILNVCWFSAWQKASVIRQKADFLRYLVEVMPDSEEHTRRCQVAYKDAKLFFIENKLQSKAEWIYLQMNYATFLYTTGASNAATFITQKLTKSLTARRCGKEVMDRLTSNLKCYSQM